MGDRVGVIFHNNFEDFSPLFYSHYAASSTPYKVRRYLMKYNSTVPKNNRDGHMYNCKHIMCGFIKTLDDSIHERVESISQDIMDEIATTKVYLNYYDGGCYIIDVSEKNFGNVSGDGNLNFIDNNILNDTSEDE